MPKKSKVKFSDQDPPPWNKDEIPYNMLAYLIDKERVVKGMKPIKVHDSLKEFEVYDTDKWRNNFNAMLKRYAAGTLTYNKRVIPKEILILLGKWSGKDRGPGTQKGLNKTMEGK